MKEHGGLSQAPNAFLTTENPFGQEYDVNVSENNDSSSFWKYVIGALLVVALIAGYIYYNDNMANNKPQVEKASYQDYFDK